MSEVICEEIIDGVKYQVSYDDVDLSQLYNDENYMSFDSEDDRQNYLDLFDNFEMSSYIVEMFVKCDHCESWASKDIIGAIHAESPEEAIDIYRNN